MEGGNQEVLDARAKLAARFGKVQVGGKGTNKIKFLFQVLMVLLMV
jgi:hypothetical protein